MKKWWIRFVSGVSCYPRFLSQSSGRLWAFSLAKHQKRQVSRYTWEKVIVYWSFVSERVCFVVNPGQLTPWSSSPNNCKCVLTMMTCTIYSDSNSLVFTFDVVTVPPFENIGRGHCKSNVLLHQRPLECSQMGCENENRLVWLGLASTTDQCGWNVLLPNLGVGFKSRH